jgi:hypothetical protein
LEIFKYLNSVTENQYYILALFSALPFPLCLGNTSAHPFLKLTTLYFIEVYSEDGREI